MEDYKHKMIKLSPIEYNGYQFLCVEYPDYIQEIGKLRVEVWKDIEGMNLELMEKGKWIDETDIDAIHWVILKDEKLVGSARMTLHEKLEDLPYIKLMTKYPLSDLRFPVASLNRLVVLPKCADKGLAWMMDEIRINTAVELGMKNIIGEPVSWRIESLKKLGFKLIGPIGYPYEAPGLLLSLMIKKLA